MARSKKYWEEAKRSHIVEFESSNDVGVRHYPEAGVLQFLKLWHTEDGEKSGFKKDPPVLHLDQMSIDEIEDFMAFIMASCNGEINSRVVQEVT